MTRETREQMKAKARPDRIPVYEANRNKITVNGLDHENYQYRWVNDTENRIATFLEGGYEFVSAEGKTVGDGGVDNVSNGRSSALSKGMGGGVIAYLMRIPKELWLEDQQRKEKNDVAALEAEMRKNARDASDFGKLEVGSRKAST